MNFPAFLSCGCKTIVATLHLFAILFKPETFRQSISRITILIFIVQPLLIHAEGFVRPFETSLQHSVDRASEYASTLSTASWLGKITPSPTALNPVTPPVSIPHQKSGTFGIPATSLTETLKNVSASLGISPTVAMFQAGTSLEMGATGPSGNGPVTSTSVTLFENGTTTYTPTTAVTYTLSNQQFAAGTVQGLASNVGLNIGSAGTAGADSPLTASAIYPLMNSIGSATNAMFNACASCTVNSSIDVAANNAVNLNLITDALINSSNTNLQALNARVHYGDLTITFNRPVSNPVLQLVGMGGSTSLPESATGKFYDLGFSTEFDLISSNVTLSKLAGNSALTVSSTSITNSATRYGASSAGSALHGITRTGASGSVLASGTNITSIVLRVYLKGDGGIVVNNTGTVQTASSGWEPKWAYAAGYTPPGSAGLAGSVGGDVLLIGASIQKPVTVSGNVFQDTNGLSDSTINGTGTNAGGLNAILSDGSGNVVDSTSVNSDGTYSFSGVGEGSYSLRLSTSSGTQGAAAPSASLPATWSFRGEGTTAGGDGTVNGTTAVTVATGVNLTGVNFGIAQPSLSLSKTNPTSFTTGSAANYTLTITNAANRPNSGTTIVVNDKLPSNFSYNSASAGTGATGASCTSSGTLAAGLDLVCSITTTAGVAAGSSAAFTINVTPQTAAASISSTNKAAVDPTGATPISPSTCTATDTPAGCAVAAAITPSLPASTAPGTLYYANSGNGRYPGSMAILDWASSALADGIQNGDQISFSLVGCRTGTLTATFSNITSIENAATYVPTDMQTWSGSSMYTAYNTAGSGEALYGSENTDVGFRVNWSMTVNGVSVTPDIFVLDAEATNSSGEYIESITNGGNWSLVDNAVGTSYTVTGLGTATFRITKSEGPSHSPVLLSLDTTQTDINISAGGRQGVAFGVLLPCDYGDAPASYGSASHSYEEEPASPQGLQSIAGQPYLGSGPPDSEVSQRDTTATGDDVDTIGDDENGVSSFPTLTTASSQTYTVSVSVNNTSGTSYLVGYIDFNRDGDFLDSGERSSTLTITGSGSQNVSFNTPSGMTSGVSYARFRLSSVQAQAELATGIAVSGEVEDYSLTIAALPDIKSYKSVKLTTDADSSSSITPGDTLTYTLQYANTDTTVITSFQIADVLPSGITITSTGAQSVSASGLGTSVTKNLSYTGGAGAVGNLLDTGATLAVQGVITVTIPVTVNTSFSGTVANQSSASGTGLIISISSDNAGTTADLPSIVTSAPYNLTIPSGSVIQTITSTTDPTTFTVNSSPPTLTLNKTVSPTGVQAPGSELIYAIAFTNTGGSLAQQVVITDAVPAMTDFKLSSATTNPGSTGLTIVVEYSNDYDSASPSSATWTYTPTSGGGGAASGYDRNVKAIRWRVTVGDLSATAPDNSGTVGFTVIIR